MIAKQVSLRAGGKSDFGALVKYITDEQSKNERVGFVNVTNCQSEDWKVAVLEVLNTQAQNTRATSDKTYHLIVSFPVGEQVTDETLKAIEKRICDGLGYGDHQRVSAVHHDTDNLHMHIAINKIHPTQYTINNPYYDHKKLGQLCEKLEREYGLQVDNHQAHKTGSENRAADMERHSGVQSLLGWIQRECSAEIKSAKSWTELHAVMRSNGLELQERGNGLVITNGEGIGVKASSVARAFSKSSLEKRLGVFESTTLNGKDAVKQAEQARHVKSKPVGKIGSNPPPRGQNRWGTLSQLEAIKIDAGPRYDAQPVRSRINTVELYARYMKELQDHGALRTTEWNKARDRKNALIESAKRQALFKRTAIKALKGAGIGKKLMYGATSQTLRTEIQKINQQYLADRKATYEKSRRPAWADWLKLKAMEGDQEALRALRAREAATGLRGNTMSGSGPQNAGEGQLKNDSITKKGTVIYRVGHTAVRDDGERLNVSRGADADGLQAALRLAAERFGNRITVNGTDAFKEQIAQAAAIANLPITFADASLDRRRQDLLQQITTKERNDERQGTRPSKPLEIDAGRINRSGLESVGLANAGTDSARTRRIGRGGRQYHPAGGQPTPGAKLPGKPNIGGIGRKPPPQSQNRLRGMSELGVVHFAKGSEMLLPGNVSHNVEYQGAKPDNGVRRGIPGPGRVVAGADAADKYIAEREAIRAKVFDIPKHTRYNDGNDRVTAFAGIRQMEGQALALLRQGEEIMVLPVDDATARRLKRVAVGESVSVTPLGSIKTKGRGR